MTGVNRVRWDPTTAAAAGAVKGASVRGSNVKLLGLRLMKDASAFGSEKDRPRWICFCDSSSLLYVKDQSILFGRVPALSDKAVSGEATSTDELSSSTLFARSTRGRRFPIRFIVKPSIRVVDCCNKLGAVEVIIIIKTRDLLPRRIGFFCELRCCSVRASSLRLKFLPCAVFAQ